MTLKPLRRVVTVRSEFPVSMAAVCPPTTHLLEWLAISLTPGLGPTTARTLVEHLGAAEAVWRALLRALASKRFPQSPATGKPAELARKQIAHIRDRILGGMSIGVLRGSRGIVR